MPIIIFIRVIIITSVTTSALVTSLGIISSIVSFIVIEQLIVLSFSIYSNNGPIDFVFIRSTANSSWSLWDLFFEFLFRVFYRFINFSCDCDMRNSCYWYLRLMGRKFSRSLFKSLDFCEKLFLFRDSLLICNNWRASLKHFTNIPACLLIMAWSTSLLWLRYLYDLSNAV